MYRYLSVVWDPNSVEGARVGQSCRTALLSRPAEWSIAHEGPGIFIINAGLRIGSAETYPLQNGSGVVLGKIFDRRQDHPAPATVRFTSDDSRKIVASGGRHLIEHYWGAYVAFICDGSSGTHHVFREPTDNMPCYHAVYCGVDIFFSDVDDCVRLLPVSFSINHRFLIRWLVYGHLHSQETGLDGVESMLPGERLTVSRGGSVRSLLWNPVTIAQNPWFDDVDHAAIALRTTVQRTVDAWASCYRNITHKLSGGLDSSIVAGCLAQSPSRPNVVCLNWELDVGFDQERLHLLGVDKRTADKLRAISGHGDERYFARLVAELWSLPLIEKKRQNALDLSRQWQLPLRIRPSFYATMDQDDVERELARTHGTEAFFTGQMGDSVLAATQQPLPAMDFAYLHGLRPELWRQLVASARLSKESLLLVLRKTIKHGLIRRPYLQPGNPLNRPSLLRNEALSGLTHEDFEGPMAKLVARSSLPPGKRLHARSLGTLRYYDYVFFSGRHADYIHPLNSQPVWELMLRMPIYTALAGGVSRGLARRAFADLLPHEVRLRQVKGTGTPFYQQLVRRNKPLLREHLLDGLLVSEGYLDRRKLEEYLAADEPFKIADSSSLLFYFTAEVWLQQWATTRQEARRPRPAAQ